jgi:hypothetical protein
MNLFISAYPLPVFCFALEINLLVKSENENNIRAKIKKKKHNIDLCLNISKNVHRPFHNSTELYCE